MKKAILIILIFTAQITYADYHYASHEGSNEYPYASWATAASLIQDAVDAASPGDTIYVGTGEFVDQQIFISHDTLSIIGQGFDSTFIWNETGSDGTIHSSANSILWVYIEGLNIQNRTNYYCIRIGTWNNLHVNQCKFSNPWDISRGQGVGTAAAPEGVIIENCVFDSIGAGIYDLFGSNKIRIENCIFSTFYHNAIEIDNYHSIFKNNILRNSLTYSKPIFGMSDTLLLSNNLIYNSHYITDVASFQNSYINNTFDLNYFSNNPALGGGY